MIEKEAGHFHCVFDIEEVSALIAIFKFFRLRGLKKLHLARFLDLTSHLHDHRSHAFFFILIRSVNIKVFQTNNIA